MPKTIDSYSHARNRARQAALARLLNRVGGDGLFFWLARRLYHLTIVDEACLPDAGACIFVINHECLLTDALVFLVVRRHRPNVHLIGWHNLRGESPIHDFLVRFGEPDIESRFLRAYKARALSAGELLRARQVLQQGEAIILAPEGELTWDGRLQYPLAEGAAWLALHVGTPLAPIISTGGYDIQPRWQMDRIHLTGRITIRVGQPFTLSESPVTHPSVEVLRSANQHLWERMNRLRDEAAGFKRSPKSPDFGQAESETS